MKGSWSPTITQGGGWDRTLTFVQSGAPFVLTSATAVMTMTPETGTVKTLSTANGKLIINGPAGTLEAKLTAAEVAAIDWDGVVQSKLVITQTGTYAEAIELAGVVNLV